MPTNPLFPDRPTHPDFIHMSHCVIATDALVEAGTGYQEVVARFVDPESVVYMAQHRVARQIMDILAQREDPDLMVLTTATWVDGFIAGACFHDQGGPVSTN